MNLQVYVGCALTHAPKEYKDMIEVFKARLGEVPWIDVLYFASTKETKPDAKHIYFHDIHTCVGSAHAMVADVSHASLGLGWELGTCTEKHKIPVFMYAPEKCHLSHLPIGAALHNDHVELLFYKNNILDVFDDIAERLKSVHSNIQMKKAPV